MRMKTCPGTPLPVPFSSSRRALRLWLMLGVLLACVLLRFWGLNWDDFSSFHPDERNIAGAVARIRLFYPPEIPRQLNPEFFAYGGLTITIYRVLCEIVSLAAGGLSGDSATREAARVWIFEAGHINLVGRAFAAFCSALTVIPLWHLARRVFGTDSFGTRVADFAGLLFAFCVTSIQIAHLDITESLLTLGITLIALVALKMIEAPTAKNYALMGVLCGLSLAAKTSALSFLVFPLTAHLIVTGRLLAARRASRRQAKENGRDQSAHPKQEFSFGRGESLSALHFQLLACAGLAGALFLLGSPFTFLNASGQFVMFAPHAAEATLLDKTINPDLLKSMRYEADVVSGANPVPYTRQFVGTPRYAFWLYNLLWQLGLVAPVCIAGGAALLVAGLRQKNTRALLFLSFPLVYFVYIGSWHTKFGRYMMPLVPFLLICGAWVLSWLWTLRPTGRVLAGALLGLTVWWALAFTSIYRHEQTRVAATRWIFANVPPGSRIIREAWDDGLPVTLRDVPNPAFPQPIDPRSGNEESLRVYDDEPSRDDARLKEARADEERHAILQQMNDQWQQKARYYADVLPQADYIAINSRRLYGTVARLTNDYPVSSRYYRLLFSEKLGFSRVREFSSYPSFGFTINDDASEETFQVYDHPKCILFKNTGRLSKEQLFQLLTSNSPPTSSLPFPN